MSNHFCAIFTAVILSVSSARGEDAAKKDSPPASTSASAAVDEIMDALKQGPVSNLTGGEMALYVLDVESGVVTLMADRPTKDLNYCGSPSWSRNGKQILFDASPGQSFGETHLKMIDVQRGKLRLTDLGAGRGPVCPAAPHYNQY